MNSHLGILLISNCSEANCLAFPAPYMGADALRRALSKVSPQACLTCITRWHLQDLLHGASDIDCKTNNTGFGGSFRFQLTLHAKDYRPDDSILMGFANLTLPALGWSEQAKPEILCSAGDDF